MLNVRPAPLEWRTGSITTSGVTPQQGSKTLRTAKNGKTYMAEPKANELRAFRRQVLELVKARYPGLSGLEPIHTQHEPVAVRIVFRMPLRKSDPAPEAFEIRPVQWPQHGREHDGPGARVCVLRIGHGDPCEWQRIPPTIWFTVAPDIDKMTRAVFDALTEAHVWHDDAQVCDVRAIAIRHPTVGATIEWRSLA